MASLAVMTCLASLGSLGWAIILRLRLQNVHNNVVGDPEKEFLDTCMRDFQGLSQDNIVYLEGHAGCMRELLAREGLKELPKIRLTVDERVCGQDNLCSSGDPGRCADLGEPRATDYQPGDVTKCYQLIGQAKAERITRIKADLLDQAERQCTGRGVWDAYEHKVQLEYCMWKHQTSGVCMNSMRSNCPAAAAERLSCCPIAQNFLGDAAFGQPARPNQYECKKSPTVGLFCQHVDYKNVVSNSTELCTQVTCPNFGWCRDLADISGMCLGEACQGFTRSLGYMIFLALLGAMGIVLDVLDMILLVWFPTAALRKTAVNMVASGLKLIGVMLVLAGGIREFAEEAVQRSCFNSEGNQMMTNTRAGVDAFLLVTIISSAGSCGLAPLSAKVRALKNPSLPYSRVQPDR